MKDRRRLLSSIGAFAGLLLIAAPAFACTNYVGKTTIIGNASSTASTVSNGLQCADDVGTVHNSVCTQGMTVSTGTGDAQAHLGGTLKITTAVADSGTTCRNFMPAQVCQLNNSSSINFPSGNAGPYDVNIINVGFASHNSNPSDTTTPSEDCMTWSGNPAPKIKVATVTVGSTGALAGASGFGTYSASFSLGTATVAVPGSPWVTNTGGAEAGMCISDIKGEDGIEVPFTIVT
jgi:hypothetical protein